MLNQTRAGWKFQPLQSFAAIADAPGRSLMAVEDRDEAASSCGGTDDDDEPAGDGSALTLFSAQPKLVPIMDFPGVDLDDL